MGVPENHSSLIRVVRGKRVIVDRDLARLYGVTTGNLNKAVRRHRERFPSDFLLRLSPEEYQALRFQIGILEKGRHSKYPVLAFTEQGVAMLSSVLRSKRAVAVNIAIMRVRLDAIARLMQEPEEPRKRSGFEGG